MENFNAVKFSFMCPKAAVKEIVVMSFDHEVNITYPQLRGSVDVVKIKGVAPIGSFELFINAVTDKSASFLDKVSFYQQLKFKLIELNENPVELPTGAKKVDDSKSTKK